MTQSSPVRTTEAGDQPSLPCVVSPMPLPDTATDVVRPPKVALWRRLLVIATGPILLFGLWYLAGLVGALNPRLIPTPQATLDTTWRAITEGSMLHDMIATLWRVLISFAIASGI